MALLETAALLWWSRHRSDHGISGILMNSDEFVLQQAASFWNILNESKFVLNASWSLTWRRPPALTWPVGNCAVGLLSCVSAFLPLVRLCKSAVTFTNYLFFFVCFFFRTQR